MIAKDAFNTLRIWYLSVHTAQLMVKIYTPGKFIPPNWLNWFYLGVCHTVGSLFNKCDNSECISVSKASTCEKKAINECDNLVYGKNLGRNFNRDPNVNFPYRKPLQSTCTGDHEFCCPAPSDDPNNCPDSARTTDCDKKKSCCCA